MRKSLKIVIVLLVVAVVAAALLLNFENRDGAVGAKREPLPLFVAADSADFMVAYAEGLGDARPERTVDGRLYRNFVQLLRTDRMRESLQDTFTTECKTGVRLALFKDTTLVEEFLLAERIGREGVPGIWTPRRYGKINKFLEDAGVHFKPCVRTNEEPVAPIAENQRPILAMPKFARSHRNRENAGIAPSVDSAQMSEGQMAPELTNGEITNNVLKVLDGIILPADTAVGEPLESLLIQWNHAEVTFYKEPYTKDSVEKKILLNDEDFKTLTELLKNDRYETYASAEGLYTLYSKVTLFKDSVAVMELWNTSKNGEWMEKFPLQNGKGFERSGLWFSANPAALKDFFEHVKAYRTE